MNTYTENVQRGIALLDKEEPGWVGHINLADLDLMFGQDCILGQIAQRRYLVGNGYEWMRDRLYGPNDSGARVWAIDHGFLAPKQETYEDMVTEYDTLTEAWRNAIVALRVEAALVA